MAAESAYIILFQNILVLLQVPSMIWSHLKRDTEPFIRSVEFELYVAKGELLLNGSYFIRIVRSHGY